MGYLWLLWESVRERVMRVRTGCKWQFSTNKVLQRQNTQTHYCTYINKSCSSPYCVRNIYIHHILIFIIFLTAIKSCASASDGISGVQAPLAHSRSAELSSICHFLRLVGSRVKLSLCRIGNAANPIYQRPNRKSPESSNVHSGPAFSYYII